MNKIHTYEFQRLAFFGFGGIDKFFKMVPCLSFVRIPPPVIVIDSSFLWKVNEKQTN